MDFKFLTINNSHFKNKFGSSIFTWLWNAKKLLEMKHLINYYSISVRLLIQLSIDEITFKALINVKFSMAKLKLA